MKSAALAGFISMIAVLSSLQSSRSSGLRLFKNSGRPSELSLSIKRRPPTTKLTVLGDSFAAGIGNNLNPDGQPDKGLACYQSNISYAGQLAAQYQINPQDYNFLACSVASLIDISHCQIKSNLTQDTDLDYDCGSLSVNGDKWGDPDLVTISIGASGSGYFDIIKNCIYFPTDSSNCLNAMANANSSLEIMQQAGDVHSVLSGVFNVTSAQTGSQLDSKSLMVVNYPLPFNTDDDGLNCPWFVGHRPDQTSRLSVNSHVQNLNDLIEAHASMVNATYIDVNPAFNGHRFCDENISDVWLNNPMNENSGQAGWAQTLVHNATDIDQIFGNITNFPETTDPRNSKNEFLFAAFHPTKDGHAAITGAILETLQGA